MNGEKLYQELKLGNINKSQLTETQIGEVYKYMVNSNKVPAESIKPEVAQKYNIVQQTIPSRSPDTNAPVTPSYTPYVPSRSPDTNAPITPYGSNIAPMPVIGYQPPKSLTPEMELVDTLSNLSINRGTQTKHERQQGSPHVQTQDWEMGRIGHGLSSIGKTLAGSYLSTAGTRTEYLSNPWEWIGQDQIEKQKIEQEFTPDRKPLIDYEQKLTESRLKRSEHLDKLEEQGILTARSLTSKADELLQSASEHTAKGKEGLGTLGGVAFDILRGAGQLGTDIAISVATGLPMTATLGERVFGQSASEARQENATIADQVAYGALSEIIAAATEKIVGGTPLAQKLGTTGAADSIVKKLANTIAKSQRLTNLLTYAFNVGGEGLEEMVEAALTPIAKRLTYKPDADLATIEEILYDGLIGAGIAAITGGGVLFQGKSQELDTAKGKYDTEYIQTMSDQEIYNSVKYGLEADLNPVYEAMETNQVSKQDTNTLINELERSKSLFPEASDILDSHIERLKKYNPDETAPHTKRTIQPDTNITQEPIAPTKENIGTEKNVTEPPATENVKAQEATTSNIETSIKQGNYIYNGLPVRYNSKMKNEASNHTTYIEVGDKFFDLDSDQQKNVLNHEVAHNNDLFEGNRFIEVMDSGIFGKTVTGKDGRVSWQGIFGDVGTNAVEETYTEALKVFRDTPEWLKENHPKVYDYFATPTTTEQEPTTEPVKPSTTNETKKDKQIVEKDAKVVDETKMEIKLNKTDNEIIPKLAKGDRRVVPYGLNKYGDKIVNGENHSDEIYSSYQVTDNEHDYIVQLHTYKAGAYGERTQLRISLKNKDSLTELSMSNFDDILIYADAFIDYFEGRISNEELEKIYLSFEENKDAIITTEEKTKVVDEPKKEVETETVETKTKPIDKALSARAEKLLDKKIIYKDTLMTRREYVQQALKNGDVLKEVRFKDIPKTNKLTKEFENLKKRVIPGLSNPHTRDSKRYFEIEKLLEDGIFKSEYRLIDSRGMFDVITKTEYDYAMYLKDLWGENSDIESKKEVKTGTVSDVKNIKNEKDYPVGMALRNPKGTKWTIVSWDGDNVKLVNENGIDLVYDKEIFLLRMKPEEEWAKNNIQPIYEALKEKLDKGEKMQPSELYKLANGYFGGLQTSGAYKTKDAYELLELALNKYIIENYNLNSKTSKGDVVAMLDKIENVLSLIPTQTKRSAEQVEKQQFSTPPNISLIAGWLASMDNNDHVLEPSAGNGGLAIWGITAKAEVSVNEIDQQRMDNMKQLGFDNYFMENAEQLDRILPDNIKPTVVIMNPPFSTALNMTTKNSDNVKKHIGQALERLQDNGRAVIIAGNTLADGKPKFAGWWKEIKGKYNVKANITIDGENYRKYGTTFDIQLMVIDKNGPTTRKVITGSFKNLEDVINALEGVRNERDISRPVKSVQGSKPETDKPSSKREDVTIRQPMGTITKHDNDSTSDIRGDGIRTELVQSETDRSDTGGNVGGIDGGTIQQTGDIELSGKGDRDDIRGDRTGDTSKRDTQNEITEGNERVPDRTNRPDIDGDANNLTSPFYDATNEAVKKEKDKNTVKELDENIVYEVYKPEKIKIKDAQSHPAELVESAAMKSVSLPDVTYTPKLPQETIKSGKLSDAQLEAIIYAGQAYSQKLPNGSTKGFYIGDGTGVGKGREIAGTMLDNYLQGRKKAVWITTSSDLIKDAKRDVEAIGWKDANIISDLKKGEAIKDKEGILVTTYSTMARGFKGEVVENEEGYKFKQGNRVEQIYKWLGPNFDGVIAFDEAHKMKSGLSTKTGWGSNEPTSTALAGIALQELMPKAKILYVSATNAVDVSDLAYAQRLGLWGEGTAFPTVEAFVDGVSKGGVGAMEVVSRDMKSMGMYVARNISFNGVEYERLEHPLTNEQVIIYDKIADAWQIVLNNLGRAIEATEISGMQRGQALSKFWGSNLRFFNQILTSMQMPSVIEDMKKQLADDKSVVLQIVSTNEESLKRKIASAVDEGLSPEEMDLTPRELIMNYLEKAFPVEQYEPIEDEAGNVRYVPVLDSQGNHVLNKESVKMRDEMLADIADLPIPDDILTMLFNEFGTDQVAEITGRKRRVVNKIDEETGQMKRDLEKISDNAGAVEEEAFMSGKKRILVFSKAGGTGRSYHASRDAENQQQRVHYLVESGYSAMDAIQGFGRTHRSNESSTPTYKLVTTNLSGQKRFISTIARRLGQLGAMTKGQRQTGGGGMFTEKDNLEGPLASAALANFYKDLANGAIEGFEPQETFQKLGLEKMLDEYDNLKEGFPELTDIPKFLNRILSLPVNIQNNLFMEFENRLDVAMSYALQNGTLDVGLEVLKGDDISIKDTKLLRENKDLNTKTEYVKLNVGERTKKINFIDLNLSETNDFVGFYQSKKTDSVRAAYKIGTTTNTRGNIVDRILLLGQSQTQRAYNDKDVLERNWEKIDKDAAQDLWNVAYQDLDDTTYKDVHMITGTLLPIWDKLPSERTRVMRTITKDGEQLLGRVLSSRQLETFMQRLGVNIDREKYTTLKLYDEVYKKNKIATIDNGWTIKMSRVNNEKRLEVVGDLYFYKDRFEKLGLYRELINNRARWFIPINNKTVNVLDELLKYNEIISIRGVNDEQDGTSRVSDDIPPEYEGITPESKKLRITPAPINITPTPIDAKFTYNTPELEEQYKRNRITKQGKLVKIAETAAEFKKAATRTHRELDPKIKENAEILKELDRYPKIKKLATDEAQRKLKDITQREEKELSREEYSRFERFLFLSDLMEEIQLEHSLPGLWTEDSAKSNYAQLEKSLTPNIKEAIERRKTHLDGVINDYIDAMGAVGYDVSDRFTKENYFRHQVLEYVNAKQLAGSGGKVRVKTSRGYTKKRVGTELAINESYLQTEYEVLATMLYDTEVAKMLKRIDKEYGIKDQLKKKAKEENRKIEKNNQAFAEAQIFGDTDLESEYKTLNRNIALGFNKLQESAKMGYLPDYNGEYYEEINALETRATSDRLWEYISLLAGNDNDDISMGAKTILKYSKEKKKFIKTLAGDRYREPNHKWRDYIPDSYVLWQPIPGKHMFTVNSISEELANAIIDRTLDQFPDNKIKVNKNLAIGMDKEQFVIPERIAQSLNNTYSKLNSADDIVHKILSMPLSIWKPWVLTGNPRLVFKYNLRNVTGDIDGLFAAAGIKAFNPNLIKRSASELYNAMRYGRFTKDLLEFRERGGYSDLMYVQELGDIDETKNFSIYNQKDTDSLVRSAIKSMPGIKTYTDFTENATNYREGILRYSAYLFYKEDIRKNNGKPSHYGASTRQRIDGLKTIEDKAYQLSKDALGSYDEITEVGQAIRKYLIPFHSWNEVNMKRYKRIFENTMEDIKLQKEVGKQVASGLKLAGYMGVKGTIALGRMFLRVAFMTALMYTWNRLRYPDEDDILPKDIRDAPHLTLGKDKQGNIVYFSRLGALNDVLDWFGLDKLPSDLKEIYDDRKTVKEQAEDMAIAPFNKIVNSINPFLKTPVEAMTGLSFYPDIRNPNTIRDKGYYVWNSITGLGEEYRLAMGLPMQTSYAESWKKALVYKADPESSAYYRAIDLKYQFQKKVLGKDSGTHIGGEKKHEALYYYKQALKYGDEKIADKYYKLYFEYGGTERGMKQSLAWLNPFAGLVESKGEREQFVEWLTEDEKEILKIAYKYYMDLIAAGIEKEFKD